MRLRAVLASLPEGYELVRGRRGWLACERAARATLLEAGFGPDGGEALRQSELTGRAPLGAIDAGHERWIVRRFHHGGILRVLGERLYLAPARPFRELVLSHALRAAGLPTPRVVAARSIRSALGWQLALVSARVEGGTDAAELVARLRRGELAPGARRRILATLGELVGRLHAARFLHADLTPRNLLVGADLASGWVLDLDRGRFASALSDDSRRDNLRRLYRYVNRREARARPFLTRGDYLRFLDAYGRALGGDPDWRSDWRAILRRDRLHRPAHRLGWWLEEQLGDGPGRRDRPAASHSNPPA
jgi:hypothetical protein